MTVEELIAELETKDPKAPVYLYDAEWDLSSPVHSVTTDDPRANKQTRLHKNSVWIIDS